MAKVILNSSLSLLYFQYFAGAYSTFTSTKHYIFMLQILSSHSCRKWSFSIHIPTDLSVQLIWNKLLKTFMMKDGYINVHWWGEFMVIDAMTQVQGGKKYIHNDAAYVFRIWKLTSDLSNWSGISLPIPLLANKRLVRSNCTHCYLYFLSCRGRL